MDPGVVFGSGAVALLAVAIAVRQDRAVSRMVEALAAPVASEFRRRGGLLAAVGRTRPGRALGRGDRLARWLVLAGSTRPEEEVGGMRLLLAASAGLFGLVLAPRAIAWIAGPVLGAGGLFLPNLLLRRAARRRQQGIELRVPDLVEVLVATAEAGLAPAIALRRAPAVLHGPLAEEIERVSAEIGLGVPWRDALRDLVDRTDVPSLRRLVVALVRSSRLGSTVRTTLRDVADDLRSARRVRAEELARRAPVKMLFPLVFLILPAFLLLTVGPAVLATLRSLQSGG